MLKGTLPAQGNPLVLDNLAQSATQVVLRYAQIDKIKKKYYSSQKVIKDMLTMYRSRESRFIKKGKFLREESYEEAQGCIIRHREQSPCFVITVNRNG